MVEVAALDRLPAAMEFERDLGTRSGEDEVAKRGVRSLYDISMQDQPPVVISPFCSLQNHRKRSQVFEKQRTCAGSELFRFWNVCAFPHYLQASAYDSGNFTCFRPLMKVQTAPVLYVLEVFWTAFSS